MDKKLHKYYILIMMIIKNNFQKTYILFCPIWVKNHCYVVSFQDISIENLSYFDEMEEVPLWENALDRQGHEITRNLLKCLIFSLKIE